MKSYGDIDLNEGSVIKNLTSPSGVVFPANPSHGEFFTVGNDTYIYHTNAWNKINSANNVSLTGWRDLTADIHVKGNGTNDPTWSAIWGNMFAYKFANATMNQFWASFHINHDYKLGSDIFLHIHWTTSDAGSGTVRWGFEYSIAKGHQQEAFPATTTVYVEQAAVATPRTHMVAEIATGLTSSSFEPDTVILVRIFRDAAHANDTCTSTVFGFTSDCHYEVDRYATLNRLPNFYA